MKPYTENDDIESLIRNKKIVGHVDYQEIQLERTVKEIVQKWTLLMNINQLNKSN